MATDPKARWITIVFKSSLESDPRGAGLRMKLGTAEALGLESKDFGTGFIKKDVTRKAHTRRAYIGGPLLAIDQSTRLRAVAVGPRRTQAKTNNKMFLRGKGKGQEAVIYYSGPRANAVDWLKSKSTIKLGADANAITLYSSKGMPLIVSTTTISE